MNFHLEYSDLEKSDYLFRCSIARGNFPLKRFNKSCSIYFPLGFSGNFLNMRNNHLLMENWLLLLFGLYNNNKFIQ